MTKVKDITFYLESLAPLALQEDYDNAGLITGNQEDLVIGVLICLDSTEAVIDEAIIKECNLVIAHHPIIFKGLKKITGNNYIERAIIKAIKNDISIYAIHTNLDNIIHGVNHQISNILGLRNARILRPHTGRLLKLITFVPRENTLQVLDAMHEAGAGTIGNYDHCSFRVSGTGRYKPNASANPHIGKINRMEEVEEDRIEVILPEFMERNVLNALKKEHPYEEVAYYIHPLENSNPESGSGIIGDLAESMQPEVFLKYLKEKFKLQILKYVPTEDSNISRIALCGGAGSFLLKDAIREGADAFISADFKYHEFFDSEGKIMIVDIGHYESEIHTKDLLYNHLYEKFSSIALQLSEVNTNPVRYI